MAIFPDIEKIDVLILCGGLGKRLGKITENMPKPMIEIRGKPFLDIIIRYAASFGFQRFILCAGYKKDVMEYYYKYNRNPGVIFSPEREDKLLGTGGAIKNARGLIKSNPFVVMNGDSFARVDLKKLIDFHKEKNALVSIALSEYIKTRNDAGAVSVNKNGKITDFSEKKNCKGNCYMNTGIYIFSKKIFLDMPKKSKFSLEYELIPALIGKNLYGYVCRANVVDIGVPARLKEAKRLFEKGS